MWETWTMRDNAPFEFPPGYDSTAILERLGQVLDPELDEPIRDLGFVRTLRLHSGHAEVALRLPTSWCAVNFAYLMAEDVRNALLSVDGIRRVSVSLGDHCAATEIEAAVNAGRPFAEAFSGEPAGSLEALRLTFLRKGFFSRQEQLLRVLRARRLLDRGDLRSTARRGIGRGRHDCDPAIRRCAGGRRVGRRIGAVFAASGGARPRLQVNCTADRRPRKQAAFRGSAASPLRGHPHRARGARGQWLILSCFAERAAPRCCRSFRARQYRSETCTNMTDTTSLSSMATCISGTPTPRIGKTSTGRAGSNAFTPFTAA